MLHCYGGGANFITMDKKIQNLAWACLPKEAREEIKQWYSNCGVINHLGISYIDGFSAALRNVFSENNLTSDTEPEGEAFIIPVEQVRETYAYNELILKHDPHHKGAQMLQSYLLQTFGDKCLPDKDISKMETTEQSSVQGEPKFKVGDKVRIKPNAKDFHNGYENGYAWLPIRDKYVGKVYRIKEIWERTNDYILDFPELISWVAIDLEPYTDPEKGNNEEISGNYSKIPNQTKDMEEKELNRKALYNALCELETASIKVRKALIQYEQN